MIFTSKVWGIFYYDLLFLLTMKSKGKLVIIGGAVNKGSFTETDFDQNVEKNLNFFERGILRKIINESKLKEDSVIEVITTASQIPDIVGPEYKKAFEFLGTKTCNILDIQNREQANSDAIVARANAACMATSRRSSTGRWANCTTHSTATASRKTRS